MKDKKTKVSDALLSFGVCLVAHLAFSNRFTLFITGVSALSVIYASSLTLLDQKRNK